MEENKVNITKKLRELAEKRKTPIIVQKQSNNYKTPRKSANSLSSQSYSSDSED
jgi:hypothetical protein